MRSMGTLIDNMLGGVNENHERSHPSELRRAKMAEQESPKVKVVAAKPPDIKTKKPPTPEEFITRSPLYTIAAIEAFYPPDRVSLHCDLPICGKETTWMRMVNAQYVDFEGTSGGYKWVWYICGLCTKNYLVVMYREVAHEQRPVRLSSSGLPRPVATPGTRSVVTKVQKIGQHPAQSVDVPKGLQKNLGEEAISLYKKVLINRNSGYGLGAVAYIRRVVEDKTNELIEVAAQLAESHNVDAAIVKKIRAAATERTTYDQKPKIPATVLPDSLLIDGINPLSELYNLVSEGVHGLTEEECIAVADETTSVFEFIFTNLRAQTAARHGFVEKVKKWAGWGTVQRETGNHSPEKAQSGGE